MQSLRNKTTAIYEIIAEKRPVAMAICESWHLSPEDISLRLSAPPGYSFVDAVRASDPSHGGLVIFYQSRFTCSSLRIPSPTTFECLCVRLTCAESGESFILLLIYRPGSQQVTNLFFEELSAVLEALIIQRCRLIIGGDLNIHVDEPTNSSSTRLQVLLSSFALKQHVSEPTHVRGHTLDLMITGDDIRVGSISVQPSGVVSDHGLVFSEVEANTVRQNKFCITERTVRSWNKVDRMAFRSALEASPL